MEGAAKGEDKSEANLMELAETHIAMREAMIGRAHKSRHRVGRRKIGPAC